MATALLSYTKYRDAQDIARASGTELLDEYKKLGGKVFEGNNEDVARYPKAFAIFDLLKPKTEKEKKLQEIAKKLKEIKSKTEKVAEEVKKHKKAKK